MIVRQHDVFDRLASHLPHPRDHVLGHRRRRLRIDDHTAIVADNDARVGVAFGRIGVQVPADLGERDRPLGKIAR